MASGKGLGRGRGRGALMFVENRAGGDAKEKVEKSAADALASLIRSLSIEPDEVELLPVSDAAKKFCKSKPEVELLVDMLYKRCLKDWKFSRCGALLCQRIMNMQVEKDSLRTVLLQTIQKDFQAKDKLRTEDPARYLGCLSFLSQILATIRDANNVPFLVLVQPVLQSMGTLLDNKANDEEIHCAAFHLGDVCSVLYANMERDKTVLFLNVIKDKIVENSGSRESRYQLIHVVEKFATLRVTVPSK